MQAYCYTQISSSSYFKVSSCFLKNFSSRLVSVESNLQLRLHMQTCSPFRFFPSVQSYNIQLPFVHTQWQCFCFSRFSYSPSIFLSVQHDLQTFSTQVVGSKVLYTRKYYIHVGRFHLTLRRPKFTHITQKALF